MSESVDASNETIWATQKAMGLSSSYISLRNLKDMLLPASSLIELQALKSVFKSIFLNTLSLVNEMC
jgi:hypothetical protein